MVAARLQRHIRCRPFCFVTGHAQGVDFGMRFTGTQMIAFTDDFAIQYNDTTDIGIRGGGKTPATRQFESARHIAFIGMQFSRLWFSRLFGQHQLSSVLKAGDLFTKFTDIFEAAIHRRETDIGDFIQPLQGIHHQIANHFGRDLTFTGRA
ncbi:hypothetical protein D3C80_1513770 [compost metagenome]